MANPSTAHEPSMEEILASIRQIISEDGDGPAAPPFDPKARAPAEAENRRKDAVQSAADDAAEPQTTSADAEGDSMKPQPSENPAKAAAQPIPAAHLADPQPRHDQASQRAVRPAAPQRASLPEPEQHLLSAQSDASVSSSFSALAHTILAQNARTLEDLVTEMLQPMLRGWLDDNLPSLVERLVKEEIDRVSRGRR